jgi:putative glutamine amidotransferase
MPVLGVCLGMQLMGLHAGGALDQHLPDSLPSAAMHWDEGSHEIECELGTGIVYSHHRQALTDAGALQVIARARDGVIEAVQRADRGSGRAGMYLGVQWHPERTENESLGVDLFARLVREARMLKDASRRV